MFLKKSIRLLLLILPLGMLSSNCSNNSGVQVPYVRIDLHLNLFGELGNPAVGSYVLVDGGVSGLIVYREDLEVFRTFDRTCTLWPDHDEQVLPDEEFDGVFTCPECKSKYLLLTDGLPIEGPATFGLREYNTVFDGSIVHVIN